MVRRLRHGSNLGADRFDPCLARSDNSPDICSGAFLLPCNGSESQSVDIPKRVPKKFARVFQTQNLGSTIKVAGSTIIRVQLRK
jgi:hypothetical protein